MNNQTQELLDISGGIVFSTIYNTNMQKDQMSITDQIIMNEAEDKILDVFLTPKSLDYNDFRHLFYPSNNKNLEQERNRKFIDCILSSEEIEYMYDFTLSNNKETKSFHKYPIDDPYSRC